METCSLLQILIQIHSAKSYFQKNIFKTHCIFDGLLKNLVNHKEITMSAGKPMRALDKNQGRFEIYETF